MKTNLASWSRGRLIAVIAAGLVLLLLIGVGVYGLITGPRQPTDRAPDPAPTITAPGESEPGKPGPPRVIPSHDPDEFARNVAEALFAWDTGSGLMPLDYSAAILEVGDPSGHEQAGLASDIAGYLCRFRGPQRPRTTKCTHYQDYPRLTCGSMLGPYLSTDLRMRIYFTGSFIPPYPCSRAMQQRQPTPRS